MTMHSVTGTLECIVEDNTRDNMNWPLPIDDNLVLVTKPDETQDIEHWLMV